MATEKVDRKRCSRGRTGAQEFRHKMCQRGWASRLQQERQLCHDGMGIQIDARLEATSNNHWGTTTYDTDFSKKKCRNELLSLCFHVFYEFSNSLVRSQTSPKSYLAMLRAKAMTNIYLYQPCNVSTPLCAFLYLMMVNVHMFNLHNIYIWLYIIHTHGDYLVNVLLLKREAIIHHPSPRQLIKKAFKMDFAYSSRGYGGNPYPSWKESWCNAGGHDAEKQLQVQHLDQQATRRERLWA